MSKITDYGALAAASVQPDDVLPIVDVHDFTQAGTGTTKKITVANLLQQVFVTEYGADPTGVADSTTAFTSAIAAVQNAGGGIVRVPAGTYTCNTAQIPTATGLHLVGDGYQCTTINATAGGSYLFNLDPPGYSTTVHVENLLITGLTLNCTGMDIFWGANMVRSRIVGNYLVQNSAGNAIMNVSTSTGTNGVTYLAENEFANKELVAGNPRTIEAWHLDHSGTGMRCNDNVWHGGGSKIWADSSGDTAMYWMKLMGSPLGSQGSKHNTWRDLIFELPNGVGGLVHLQNVANPTFDTISMEDLSTNPVGQPLFLFDSLPGGSDGCRGITFRNYSRRAGSNISNSLPDFKFDVNCTEILLDSPQENGGGHALTIDYGSCAGPVTEIAPSPTVIRLNLPTIGNYLPVYPGAFPDPAANLPSDMGYVGWAYDPAPLSNTTGNLLQTAGQISLIKIPVRQSQTVSNIRCYIATAGSGLTTGQCFAGIYNSSGSLVASTADQSTAWASTGDLDMALTGAPITVSSPYVYVALVYNGTTSPNFWGNTSRSGAQASGPGSALRYRLANTGVTTALPASLAGSSATSRQIWVAIW